MKNLPLVIVLMVLFLGAAIVISLYLPKNNPGLGVIVGQVLAIPFILLYYRLKK